jgi:hypothetical protein
MRSFRRSSEAVTPALGAVLLIGILIVLAAAAAILAHRFNSGSQPVVDSSARAAFTSTGYVVTLAGPDSIPITPAAKLLVSIDGVTTTMPLSVIASQLPDHTVWRVGDPVCLVGSGSCAVASGSAVGVRLVVNNDSVFDLPPLQYVVAGSSFLVSPTGSVTVSCTMPVALRIVGVSITHGAGGTEIPVYAGLSTNGLSTFTPLVGGAELHGGEVLDLHNIPAGSILGVQGNARDSTFDETYDSLSGDPHVQVLRDGAHAPAYAPFGNQASLESFLLPYVNTGTQTMTLGPNEVIMLFEFSSPLDSSNSAADFQDLVVLFQFGQLTC